MLNRPKMSNSFPNVRSKGENLTCLLSNPYANLMQTWVSSVVTTCQRAVNVWWINDEHALLHHVGDNTFRTWLDREKRDIRRKDLCLRR